MPKAGPVTIRYADGRSERKTQRDFDRRAFLASKGRGTARPWAYGWKHYLRSKHWRSIRARALKRDSRRCQTCRRTRRLEVHHLTYERLGEERLEDLVTLCQRCHSTAHQWERRGAGASRIA